MKSITRSLAIGLTLVVLAPLSARAQGTNVAVLDIGLIFKNHQRFNQSMERIKAKIDAFEAQLKTSGKSLQTSSEKLKQFNPGTASYKAEEARIEKLASDLQLQKRLKTKEFLEEEARVYYQAYNEVLRVVSVFCEQHNIGLVIRYNSTQIDPTKRESVLQGVNRAVVFQDRLDITKDILAELNRGAPAPRNAGRVGPQLPRPR
ncbi:MAG: OmpH family outer membrane protein [Pirellulaceae bacterium]|nr:OmpH family outer membrane protein [Pirellulaceae bacterium]MDP7014697.1 OmpH family outer membrane protein [Pirellulaceae bacterium]